MVQRLATLTARVHARFCDVVVLESRLARRAGLLLHALLAGIGVAGIALAVTEAISVGELVTLFIVTSTFVGLISQLSHHLPDLQAGLGAVIRLRQMLALSRAGFLTFLGSGLSVEIEDGAEPAFVATSSALDGPPLRATTFVDARLASPSVRRSSDPMLRSLMAAGALDEETLSWNACSRSDDYSGVVEHATGLVPVDARDHRSPSPPSGLSLRRLFHRAMGSGDDRPKARPGASASASRTPPPSQSRRVQSPLVAEQANAHARGREAQGPAAGASRNAVEDDMRRARSRGVPVATRTGDRRVSID